MAKSPVKTTARLSEKSWNELTASERKEIENVLRRMSGVRDVNQEYVDHRTIGQRAAEGIAHGAGSWAVNLMLLGSLVVWDFLNTAVLGPGLEAVDP